MDLEALIDVEALIDEQISSCLGWPREGTGKQILIVRQVTPRLGAWQNRGEATEEGGDILFVGSPSPHSDQEMKTAIIRFTTDDKLRAPNYSKDRHQITFQRSFGSLGGFLLAMQRSPAVFVWIGFYDGHTYADMHCLLNTDISPRHPNLP